VTDGSLVKEPSANSSALKGIIRAIGQLPRRPRELVYAAGGLQEGISSSRTGSVEAERIAARAAGLYPERP
jgi:hypothetical protein